MASLRERPKSANPNRRGLRTATHKVTDPRVVQPLHPEVNEADADVISGDLRRLDVEDSLSPECPASKFDDDAFDWTGDSGPGPSHRRYSLAAFRRPSPTYDSLLTFECIQKASALRVLAKTLDRQRDVAANHLDNQSSGTANSSSTSSSSVTSPVTEGAPPHFESAYRKSTPPPRKLRPIQQHDAGDIY